MAGKIKKTLKSEICAVMVALALAGGAREASGTLSNSIVKDNIEYLISEIYIALRAEEAKPQTDETRANIARLEAERDVLFRR